MEKNDLIKAVALFFISFCLLGFIIWTVNKSDRLETSLLSELDEVAELDNELCPFDGDLTKTSRVILFDFSEPLPPELGDYPVKLLNNMMSEIQDAERFDRFSLYTLNPYGETPKDINVFCVPVTINQIPRDIRKNLWGKDPDQHSTLPSRYHRFAQVFERLWDNEHELNASMKETVNTLKSESRREQSYSRIVENIEEIAGLEIDRGSRKINVIVFSDMLQNSPLYSHYSSSWEFEEYLSRRSQQLLSMERFSFEIYFVQSCLSLSTKKRRALQDFWEDYFNSSNASVKFKLLRIDGGSCKTENPANNILTAQTLGAELTDDNMDDISRKSSRETVKSFQGVGMGNEEKTKGQDDLDISALDDALVKDDSDDKLGRPTGEFINPAVISEEMINNKAGRYRDNSEPITRTELPDDIDEQFTEQINETVTPVTVVVGMAHEDNSLEDNNTPAFTKNNCPTPKLNTMPTLKYPKTCKRQGGFTI